MKQKIIKLLLFTLFWSILITSKTNAQCDKQEITAIRQSANQVCVPLTEHLNFTYDTLYPNVQLKLDWGDGTTEILSYDRIATDDAIHTYTESSCTKKVTLNGTLICKNCYAISLIATRDGCPSTIFSFSLASSLVEVYSKPEVLFDYKDDVDVSKDTTNLLEYTYNTCKMDTVLATRQNPKMTGAGCTSSSEPFEWSYEGITNPALAFSDAAICDSIECDSTYAFDFPEVGTYKVTLSQENSCGISTFSDTLIVRPLPKIGFETDNVYNCYPADIRFINNSDTTVLNTTWIYIANSDTTLVQRDTLITDGQQLYLDEGEYRIVMQGKDLYCTNEVDTTLVFDMLCEDLYVPNAFIPDSPNPDLNTFRPVAINLIKYRINVYDLHGKLLWTSDKLNNGVPAEGWDGTFRNQPCPQGTYVWKIEATLDDGYTTEGVPWKGQKLDTDEKRTVGTISIIR